MSTKYTKQLISVATLMLQAFCAIWFIGRAAIGFYLLTTNWEAVANRHEALWDMLFGVILFGLLPIQLFTYVRQFLHSMLENSLFSERNYHISCKLLTISGVMLLLMLVYDVLFSHKPYNGILDVIDNLILSYLPSYALLAVLATLVLVIKTGKVIQDDRDGFI